MNNNGSWGYHLLLDCKSCDINSITSRANIEAFSKSLVREIDMVAYGNPMIEHFATHDEDKAGWSLVQLIETSNITAHFCDKTGDAYIDIFSCKPFDAATAIEVVHFFFEPESISVCPVCRDANNTDFPFFNADDVGPGDFF